ncbi:saccharopine dehydrogenase NADP-binding domain-containing protein [Streptomyces sp. NBRC 14336]|uniref:saccharopine dehydrogenase family protein n=1 Tax=Streptomyces sp. NBRC 14336 TaxID=3030992 RepID=UPI0025544DCD|nr:saccharopine dehydrogenase NADP-binding domain-containing protein [Streptomyces sp. NBRC 14336]
MTTGDTRGRILVIGGYGAVGSAVGTRLEERFPGRVVPAGRNEVRARRLGGVRVDVRDLDGLRRTLDKLGDVRVVVLCVEPEDASLARVCLERGIHLVDVNATRDLLEAVADLDGVASGAGATAVLSVGVAPGLTNLLAHRAHEAVGGAQRLDVTVLLGSGERHGTDAVRWTVENLTEPVTAAPRSVYLPGHGTHRAYPFPFSDQHTLRRTLGVPQATTRLCLDSRPLTAALFALRGTGVLRGEDRAPLRRSLTGAFSRVHVGAESFALRADAWRDDRHAAFALTGHEQSRVTGLVAAEVASELLRGQLPPGVHHIEQLPELADVPERLAGDGVSVLRRHSGRD